MKLSNSQFQTMKDAVYAISDATCALEDLNAELIAEKNYAGQGDIAALVDALNTLKEDRMRHFLKII